MQGGCTCGTIRYALKNTPLFVHCCHCTWCQRETGSAFAVNVLIETAEINLTAGKPSAVAVPTNSGRKQTFMRCPDCQIALWSHYPGMGKSIAFIRAGTLDDPSQTPPDIHIYTSTKQPHVKLNTNVPIRTGYYDRAKYWPEDSLTRFAETRNKSAKS